MIRQLVAGMPGSGKSTFLAALRHLLVAAEVPTRLGITGLVDDESHLNRLEHKWLACEEVERTKPATEGWVEFKVVDKTTGTASVMSIPDLRGEAFEQPACIGQCDSKLFEALIEADGVLLFTNADKPVDSLLLDDLGDILDSGKEGPPEENTVFKPEDMPEEVKIVEFLQCANRRPQEHRRRKLVVAVSAWDVVESHSEVSPAEWLSENRPMLHQFLENNEELWELRVYGISAQGGRLPQNKKSLEELSKPSERIKVVGHDANAHDLSALLGWIMSKD